MLRLPTHEELHVVSDLHLGGETTERQIFDQGDAFATFVDSLLRRASGNQALLINGDLVDFLAEPDPTYFDPLGAAEKLDRIFRDPSFVPVWDALRRFLRTANRTLIITLGNHDLELALPWIREQLLRELAGGDNDARARIKLAFEENGYRCRVGEADVLCMHGNEVDPWNVTDFETLRQIGRDYLRGAATFDWTPNGGTKLVIDVMNGIKAEYPFVDLLKPEAGAVVPTLLALDPGLAPKVGDAMPSWFRRTRDWALMATGFLSDAAMTEIMGGPDAAAGPVDTLHQMLGDTYGGGGSFRGSIDLRHLLEQTETRLHQGVAPVELLGRGGQPQYLGVVGAVWDLIRGKGRAEVLREALEKLQKDRGFHLATSDKTYRSIDRATSPDIDFIVTGHTHMQRALTRGGGHGYYYNSGTWVRLIQLRREVLASERDFQRVFDALSAGSMEKLDACENLILRRPAAVHFGIEHGRTFGQLRQVEGQDVEVIDRSRYEMRP